MSDLVSGGIDPVILRQTLSLPHPQMRIVVYYLTAAKDPEFGDAVVKTGEKIAEEIGMNRPLLSKTLPLLIQAGWLRLADRHGNVNYYGLGPLAEARSNVVPLRRSA
ncbi:hypothetical protein [Streptomyces sp. NPDC087538]|uniref:hypothetical protein n=1 Tax=Streptomyces sp. NPDC087538 TaxID=3365797 RepID=UPI0037F309B2